MQILITSGGTARSRVLNLNAAQLSLLLGGLVFALIVFSGLIYHFIFLTAAREGWPVVSQLVKLVVRDEFAQRDRFMRENLDAMASRVGDLQARMVKLEAMGERVSGLAGVKLDDLKAMQGAPAKPAGSGGPYIPLDHPTLEQLNDTLSAMENSLEQQGDIFILAESRLFEKRLSALMVPNSKPIDMPTGSPFGFRSDPFTGRAALHTGIDFAADPGTPIRAAAGGVVLSTDYHPQYGNLLELDHGNGLVTRYAHTSKILVKAGDLVKRGQQVALVGNTGRSTGPHLHFEVLVEGVPQNPAKFLDGGANHGLPQVRVGSR